MSTFAPLVFVAAALAADGPTAPAHFHHLHLNSTGPARAIDFYTRTFDCEKASHQGDAAVWAQKSWLLFNKVSSQPPASIVSSIWHFGWGAENMKEAYQQQLERGTKFATPITEMFPNFFFAYVAGPDGALIELNTANHHHFGHLHLLSADPVSAGEWYMRHFGATRRGTQPPSREPRFLRGWQIGPSMSLMMDNVNIIIYPVEYARQAFVSDWKDRTAFETTKGRVVDHLAFSVDDVAAAAGKLVKEGVKIVERKGNSALVEGPDRILIEIVEGHARR
ncbi:MAG: VOC family protein [Bryobacteraceae bacterium]